MKTTIIIILTIFMMTTLEAKKVKIELKSNLSFRKINNSKFLNRGDKFSKASLDVSMFTKRELNKIMNRYMHRYYRRKLNKLQKRAKINIFKEIKAISLSGIVKKNRFNNLNLALFVNNQIKQNSIAFIRETFKEMKVNSYNILLKGKNRLSLKKLFSKGILGKPKKIITINNKTIILRYKKSFDLISKDKEKISIIHIRKKYSKKTLFIAKDRLKRVLKQINTNINSEKFVAEMKYDNFPIGDEMSKINLKAIEDKNHLIKLDILLSKLPKRFHNLVGTWMMTKYMVSNIFNKEKIKQKNKEFLNYLITNSTLLLNKSSLSIKSWVENK